MKPAIPHDHHIEMITYSYQKIPLPIEMPCYKNYDTTNYTVVEHYPSSF